MSPVEDVWRRTASLMLLFHEHIGKIGGNEAPVFQNLIQQSQSFLCVHDRIIAINALLVHLFLDLFQNLVGLVVFACITEGLLIVVYPLPSVLVVFEVALLLLIAALINAPHVLVLFETGM